MFGGLTMSPKTRPGSLLAWPAVALLSLAVLGVAPASATTAASSTRLRLEADLYAALRESGVKVEALKPAKAKGRTAVLPVSNWMIGGDARSGYLFNAGGVRLRAGRRTATLRLLTLNLTEGWLSAKIGAKQMKVATTHGLRPSRDGFGWIVVLKRLALTARAAGYLNRALGLHGVFASGATLADLRVGLQRDEISIAGGAFTLSFDEAFRAKLEGLDVTVVPYGATVSPMPLSVTIPVERGYLTPDLSSGQVAGEAGFQLVQEFLPPEAEAPLVSQVTLGGMGASFESKAVLGYLLVSRSSCPGTDRFFTLDFGGAVATPDPSTRTVVVPQAVAALEPSLADCLNELFAKPKGQPPVFEAGERVGTLSFELGPA